MVINCSTLSCISKMLFTIETSQECVCVCYDDFFPKNPLSVVDFHITHRKASSPYPSSSLLSLPLLDRRLLDVKQDIFAL